MQKVELGDHVRDRVTGFQGVVTAHCHYLNEEDRYRVEGPVGEKNEPKENWFTVSRLEVISANE